MSAFSAFSAFSLCRFSSDPCFSGVRGTFRIFRIFPVSGSNRWLQKSDRPVLLWPALGERETNRENPRKNRENRGKIGKSWLKEQIRTDESGSKCTTASQPQSLAIFWIASDIARNFAARSKFCHFHRKMHRNRNRIVTAEKSQPISHKGSLRTIWLSKRIADLDRKSSPGDGALRSGSGNPLVWTRPL